MHRSESLAALRVEGADKPGVGAQITRAIANTGINLRGLQAAVIGGKFVCLLAFDSVADASKATRALAKKGKLPPPKPVPRPGRIIQVQEDGKVETETNKDTIIVEIDPDVTSKRTAEHRRLVIKFVELFENHGLTCYEDPNSYDLLTEQTTEALLMEMKTITDENDEREQIRRAVGQLAYYIYFGDMPQGKRIQKGVALSRKLFKDELVEFLRSLGIYVFWLDEKGKITGEKENVEFLNRFCNPTK